MFALATGIPKAIGQFGHSPMGLPILFMKSPAVLFYTSDFLTGTMLMTNEQVGMYVRLLCIQHQSGHLSEKTMLQICGSHDEKVWEKFKKRPDGSYHNLRMHDEIVKRQKYSDSRSKNIGSRWDKNDKPLSNKRIDKIHMKNICNTHVIHMEDENEDEDSSLNPSSGRGIRGNHSVGLQIPDSFNDLSEILMSFVSVANGVYYSRGKPQMSQQVFECLLMRLQSLSGQDRGKAKAIVEQSIRSQYTEFYDLSKPKPQTVADNDVKKRFLERHKNDAP